MSNAGWTWEDMLGEFRLLGGAADNVRLGSGPRGRGLFPADPSRDVRVVVPVNLLFQAADVVLNDRDELAIRPDASVGPRERSFFERFEKSFSYGAGGADDCFSVLQALHELPETVKEYLQPVKKEGVERFPAPTKDLVLKKFVETRRIADNKLMPVLELANHSSDHPPFDTNSGLGPITLSGRFSEEVLARYTRQDTWRIFTSYGFVCTTPVAYSRPLKCQLREKRLHIDGDYASVQQIDGILAPTVTRKDGAVVLSHLVLGSRKDLGLPKWVFYRLMRENGISRPEEFFDLVSHLNRSWFLGLLAAMEGFDGAMIKQLREAARVQLETLSFCVATPPLALTQRSLPRRHEAVVR
jgi:hypothetical protein